MESMVQDYRIIDGINIAHSGRTSVSLFRFGESPEGHSRTRMEEIWNIEEVDFNIKGLSMDCFLPPGDLKKEDVSGFGILNVKNYSVSNGNSNNVKLGPFKIRTGKVSVSKVVAIDDVDSDESEEEEEL